MEHIEKRRMMGILMSISVSSLLLFNKVELIKYNIILNIIFITYFFVVSFFNNTKLRINDVIIIYSIFSVFSLLSIFWSIDTNLSIMVSIKLFSLLLTIFVTYNVLKIYKLYDYFAYGIFFTVFINYVISFNFINIGINIYKESRFVGTSNNANAIAILMMFSVFLSILYLQKSKKRYVLILNHLNLIFALYITVLTVSRKGIIAVLSLILIYLITTFLNPKKVIFILFFTLFIFISFNNISLENKNINYVTKRFEGINFFKDNVEMDNSTRERLGFVKRGWEIFLENPIVGRGVGTFSSDSKRNLYSHNNFIEILSGVGIIGLFIYYLIFISIFTKIKRSKIKSQKKYFLVFITFLFFMDLALVSYYSRIHLVMMMYLIAYMEEYIGGENIENIK